MSEDSAAAHLLASFLDVCIASGSAPNAIIASDSIIFLYPGKQVLHEDMTDEDRREGLSGSHGSFVRDLYLISYIACKGEGKVKLEGEKETVTISSTSTDDGKASVDVSVSISAGDTKNTERQKITVFGLSKHFHQVAPHFLIFYAGKTDEDKKKIVEVVSPEASQNLLTIDGSSGKIFVNGVMVANGSSSRKSYNITEKGTLARKLIEDLFP